MPIPKVREIIKIESNCCPYTDYDTVSPFCVVYNYENKIIYNNEDNCSAVKVNNITSKDGRGIVFNKDNLSLEICGDVMVSLFHYRMVKSSKMFFGRVLFNTAFIEAECNEIAFSKKILILISLHKVKMLMIVMKLKLRSIRYVIGK